MAKKQQKQPSLVDQRVDDVRSAVAKAATGLTPGQYREFMDVLISDADGWRAEAEENQSDEGE